MQASIDDPHAAMDATWHRQLGVLAMAGPGIKEGEVVYGANLLDIAPTALALLGLPVGADMDGRVLVEAIDRPVSIDRVFGWDDVPGEAGLHPPDLRLDPFEACDAMKQLADLGYVQELPEAAEARVAVCRRETRFNLGVVYMTTQRPAMAEAIFRELHAQHPQDPRFTMNLAHCVHTLGRPEEAAVLLEQLAAERPDLPDALLLRGSALFAIGKVEEAAACLEEADRRNPDRPDLLCTLADAYTRLKRWNEAEAKLTRAGEIDPHDAMVHHKRAWLELSRERFDAAVEHSLRAVELRHFFPEAHYAMGVALTWMKDYRNAIRAFEVAISMRPGMIDAHRYVASIYRLLEDRHSARPYRDAAERLLQAAQRGEASPESAMVEPPMGPQEWERRLES
jgi:tetratricopeptide (TPR) repeat protein